MTITWDDRFASRTRNMKSSAIRELLKLTEQPDIISFGGGLPAPDVFPVEAIAAACQQVLLEKGKYALQYSTTEGYLPLRELIIEISGVKPLNITPDNIMITSGSQQALDLIGKIFLNRGDRILVESPTYLGALQAWNAYGAEYVSIPSDENGMITDSLEQALRSGPKFIYALPTFQNPTGSTLPLERRQKLVELADRFGVPIVEDDPYGQLRFEGKHLPTLFQLDAHIHSVPGNYSGNVIYLSTFSKILTPGLRLAWITAPDTVIRKFVMAKQGVDLHTSTFNQVVAHQVSRNGFLDRHIQTIQKVYHERRDVMLDVLDEQMPAGVTWNKPQGGLFLWLKVPEPLNSTELLQIAVEKEKVAFVPGQPFFPNGGGENTMRINFSFSNPGQINEGIARLARVIRGQIHPSTRSI